MIDAQIAYFDNAATSFPKPKAVYDFADSFYRSYGVNIGRSQYSLTAKASVLLEETRELMLALYECENKQVVFTSSATEAINKILLGLDLRPHSVVYISPFEHNAVTRALHGIKRALDIDIRLLPFNKNSLEFDYEKARTAFQQLRPDLVVATHASNVCGTVLPINSIFSLAKAYNATTIVDMSQTAGLLTLQLNTDEVDYAVFAGHKSLFAPFGIGGFICSKSSQLTPVFFGGTGIESLSQDMPQTLREQVEIGSQNVYAIAGLNAALKWIMGQGLQTIRNEENRNADRLRDILRAYDNLRIVAEAMTSDHIGVVSVLFDGYSPDEIGMVFNSQDVAVRTGLHCAPYAHDFLNTSPIGTVRLSISCLTAEKDFRQLSKVLDIVEKSG